MRNIADVTLSAYNAWQDTETVSVEDANEILNLVNNPESMTNRDWYLGLPMETENLENATNFTLAVLEASEIEKDMPHVGQVPLLTCLGMFTWELGLNHVAESLVKLALGLNPEYSLAQLAARIFEANWPGESLKTMRDELHPQVRVALNS